MWHKIILIAIASIGFACASMGQYYTINLDSQSPAEQPVIDRAFSGNSIFLRAYCFDSGVAVDLTTWAMTFRYSYGQYSTQGMVTVSGTVSSNRVDFTGLTNIYAKPFNDYYWSISGIKDTGLIKTFGTGTLKVEYDPATSTNIVTLMEQVNIAWMTNWLGAQVESNRLNIIVLTTGKTDLVTYNAHVAAQGNTNAGFEGRIAAEETKSTAQVNTNAGFQALHTAQGNTNTGFEVRIHAIETGSIVTVESDPIYESEKSLYYLASNPNNYLSTTTNIFTAIYAADRSKLNTNIAGLTQGVYTGSLTSVSYTGVTVMVIGRTYAWGYTKIGADGTSTLSIASQSLSATAAGLITNHFTYTTTDTNLILKLDGNGLAICNVSNVYVKEITNGSINAYRVNVGAGGMWAGGMEVTNPAVHIAATGTNVHGLGDLLESKLFVATYSGEQIINAGSSIVPHSNVRLNNTNGVLVTLGNPQIITNLISDGTTMTLRGATGTGEIKFVNGNGMAMDCALGFLLKPEDVLQFVFLDGKWTEVKRIDK